MAKQRGTKTISSFVQSRGSRINPLLQEGAQCRSALPMSDEEEPEEESEEEEEEESEESEEEEESGSSRGSAKISRRRVVLGRRVVL
jgi:ribosomal protein L12E/L44/L45/RPP1/RPP2